MRDSLLHAARFLREIVRDLPVLALCVLTPLFFLGLTAVGYGRDPMPPAWPIACEEAALSSHAGLEAALRSARHPDGRRAFALRLAANAAEAESNSEGKAPVLVLLSGKEGALELRGDALSADFMGAADAVEEALDCLAASNLAASREARPDPPRLRASEPPYRESESDFERYMPGMMVFAVLLLIPQTAVVLSREIRRGGLKRLRLAGIGSPSYLGGVAISQGACALALGLILVAAAAAVGYSLGDSPFLAAAEAFGVLVALGLGSIAQGLLVGSFAKSDSAAINLGSCLTMLEVFLSGSFFALPAPAVFASGTPGSPGYFSIGAFDLFPATHSLRALHRVFLEDGRGALPPVIATLALGLAFFMIAAAVFSRERD
jgi:ABC-type multidrug transport system permease subunit